MSLLLLAIDMALVYLVFAILVSGIQECIARIFSKRGKFLRRGLSQLIGDDKIFKKVIAHPLIAGTGKIVRPSVTTSSAQGSSPGKSKPPSYVDPENLALALAYVLTTHAADATDPAERRVLTFATLRDALAQETSPIADALLPILDSSDKTLDKALEGIRRWYSHGMDRVSGWYKAYAQRWLLGIGFVVALLANVNSIAIFEALNHSSGLAGQIAVEANAIADGQSELTPEISQAIVKHALAAPAAGLPIGYDYLGSVCRLESAVPKQKMPSKPVIDHCSPAVASLERNGQIANLLYYVLGCALTAVAGALGAPFWFAALADILKIRGSGPKPASPQTNK